MEKRAVISKVKKINNETIKSIVDIHMVTFPGFFLTFLGKGFLKHLYKGFCEHEKSGLLIAIIDKTTVGFLAYSEDISNFYKYLIRHKLLSFAWYSLGAFLRKPSTMFRLIRAFLKPDETKREEKYVELSSIGVDPKMKNKHIGSRLINALKIQYQNKPFSYIKLETDAEDNDNVNRFYIKNGFVLDHSYITPEGRKMNEYRWSLHQ